MYFNMTFNENVSTLSMFNHPIEIVDTFKFLGYTLDNKLKFDKQLDLVISRLSMANAKIHLCKSFLPTNTLKLLFNCIGLPYLLYSAPILLNCSKTYFNRVNSKYRECFRSMLPTHAWNGTRTDQIMKILGVSTLDSLILRHMLQIICKTIFTHEPANLSLSFHTFNPRTCNYFIPRLKFQFNKKRAFSYYGPFLWAQIPTNLKQSILSSEKLEVVDDVDLDRLFSKYRS